MPKDLTQLTLDDFSLSKKVDWLNHPNFTTPRRPGMLLNNGNRRYRYNTDSTSQLITVDTSQNNDISFNICSENFFDSNFKENDPVLLAGNTTQTPIMVTFDPPVQAVGAHVSANGGSNQIYWGFQYVSFSDNEDWQDPLSTRGLLSNTRDTAIFLGVQALNGQKIYAVAFDVSYAGTAPALSLIAINTLHYIPS